MPKWWTCLKSVMRNIRINCWCLWAIKNHLSLWSHLWQQTITKRKSTQGKREKQFLKKLEISFKKIKIKEREIWHWSTGGTASHYWSGLQSLQSITYISSWCRMCIIWILYGSNALLMSLLHKAPTTFKTRIHTMWCLGNKQQVRQLTYNIIYNK